MAQAEVKEACRLISEAAEIDQVAKFLVPISVFARAYDESAPPSGINNNSNYNGSSNSTTSSSGGSSSTQSGQNQALPIEQQSAFTPNDEFQLHSGAWSLLDAKTGCQLAANSISFLNGPTSFEQFIEQLDEELSKRPNCLLVAASPLTLRQHVHPAAMRLKLPLAQVYYNSYADLSRDFWSRQHERATANSDYLNLYQNENGQCDEGRCLNKDQPKADGSSGLLGKASTLSIESPASISVSSATDKELQAHEKSKAHLDSETAAAEASSNCQMENLSLMSHNHRLEQDQQVQLEQLQFGLSPSDRNEIKQVEEIIKFLAEKQRQQQDESTKLTPTVDLSSETSSSTEQSEASLLNGQLPAIRQLNNMKLIIEHLLSDGHQFNGTEQIKRQLEVGLCDAETNIADSTVVRARGLPWQATEQDIANFFAGLNISKGGVGLCLSRQGRRNGEALIKFDCAEHRNLALARHKQFMGSRYIEVYRATGADFLSVASGYNKKAHAFLSRGPHVIIRMRGLPFTCVPKQVIEFFSTGPTGSKKDGCQVLGNEDGILFVKNQDDKLTGDAFVLFASDELAQRALLKHHHNIGSRYVELFRSTVSEVQQVLSISMEGSSQNMIIDSSSPANSNSAGVSSSYKRQAANFRPIAPDQGAPIATYAQVTITSNGSPLNKSVAQPAELETTKRISTPTDLCSQPEADLVGTVSKLSIADSGNADVSGSLSDSSNESAEEAGSSPEAAKGLTNSSSSPPPVSTELQSSQPQQQQSQTTSNNNSSLSPISTMSETSSPALSQASSYKSSHYGVPSVHRPNNNSGSKQQSGVGQTQQTTGAGQQTRGYQHNGRNNSHQHQYNPASYYNHQMKQHYNHHYQSELVNGNPDDHGHQLDMQRHQQVPTDQQHQHIYAPHQSYQSRHLQQQHYPFGFPIHPAAAAMHATPYPPYHHPGYPASAQMAYLPQPQAIHYFPAPPPQPPAASSTTAASSYHHEQQQQPLLSNKRDCIRLRGLPFEAQVEDILCFLGSHSKHIVYQGVHMVYSVHGQPSGEAIVQMSSCHAASMAATEHHLMEMSVGKKHRYIEVMPCSIDDLQLSSLPVNMLAGRSLIAPRQQPATSYRSHLGAPQPYVADLIPSASIPSQRGSSVNTSTASAQVPTTDASCTSGSSATESSESAAEDSASDVKSELGKQQPGQAQQQQQVTAVAAAAAATAAAAAHYYPILYYYPQQMVATPYG